jgi:hypothetical protein
MRTEMVLLDCPAILDGDNLVRCGLPAEMEYRHPVMTTAGPLDVVKINCPRGHWFLGPVEILTLEPPPIGPGNNDAVTEPGPTGSTRPRESTKNI